MWRPATPMVFVGVAASCAPHAPYACAGAYCIAPFRASTRGVCETPPCAADEAVDVAAACVPIPAIAHGGRACDPKSALLIAGGRAVCVPPDAACPRGTNAAPPSQCAPPPSCPP